MSKIQHAELSDIMLEKMADVPPRLRRKINELVQRRFADMVSAELVGGEIIFTPSEYFKRLINVITWNDLASLEAIGFSDDRDRRNGKPA